MSRAKSWHEDDTFWKVTLPVLFPDSRVQEAQKEIEQILTLAKIPTGAAVLARIFRPRDWYEQDGLLVLEERKLRGRLPYTEISTVPPTTKRPTA